MENKKWDFPVKKASGASSQTDREKDLMERLERLHRLLEALATRFTHSLPHEPSNGTLHSRNRGLPSKTRTHLQFIEQVLADADQIVLDARLPKEGEER